MVVLLGIGFHIVAHHSNRETANFNQALMLEENSVSGQIAVNCIQVVHVVQRRQQLIAPP